MPPRTFAESILIAAAATSMTVLLRSSNAPLNLKSLQLFSCNSEWHRWLWMWVRDIPLYTSLLQTTSTIGWLYEQQHVCTRTVRNWPKCGMKESFDKNAAANCINCRHKVNRQIYYNTIAGDELKWTMKSDPVMVLLMVTVWGFTSVQYNEWRNGGSARFKPKDAIILRFRMLYFLE